MLKFNEFINYRENQETIAQILQANPNFQVIKLAMAGRVKGRHPGYKPARVARANEIADLQTYPSSVASAIANFDGTNFNMGVPAPYYSLESAGDEYILVPKSFPWKTFKWVYVPMYGAQPYATGTGASLIPATPPQNV